ADRGHEGHGGAVEMRVVLEADDFEVERVAGVDAALERSHVPAMDVEVAVERAVRVRVADEIDEPVAARGVEDAVPAAGKWRFDVDRGMPLGPWPSLDRVHGAPDDPGGHADGQGD